MIALPGNAVGPGSIGCVGPEPGCGPGVTAPGTDFSLGDGGVVADELVGTGVSAGFSLVSLLQAVSDPIPTIASAPAARASCRVNVDDMLSP